MKRLTGRLGWRLRLRFNVDNHRVLMGDVYVDIKDLSGAYDRDGVMDIYENGEHAEKSDGSYKDTDGLR